MIQVTTTELKTNTAKYITLANKEDIIITRNGKPVARLIGQKANKVEMAQSLFGILKDVEINEEVLKEERRSAI